MPAQGGLRILSSDGAIKPIATWGLGARAGDFVFVAGMRGIDLANNAILGSEEERIRQAFTNMKMITESEDASLASCVRLTVFATHMKRLRPLVNKIQEQLLAGGPYPPRTILVRKVQSGQHFRDGRDVFAPA